jgi:hypothetical protein
VAVGTIIASGVLDSTVAEAAAGAGGGAAAGGLASWLGPIIGAVLPQIIGQFAGGASPQKAQAEQLFEQQTLFGEQQGFEQQLARLWQNPWSVTQTPGYQFNLQQGLQAVQRQYGRAGIGGSGTADIGLMNYAQGFAQNSWMQQLGMLAGLSGIQTPTYAYGPYALQGAQQGSQAVQGIGQGIGNVLNTVFGWA